MNFVPILGHYFLPCLLEELYLCVCCRDEHFVHLFVAFIDIKNAALNFALILYDVALYVTRINTDWMKHAFFFEL